MAVKSGGKLSAQVLKAMSIFSGVQFVQIICAIVRNKAIALLIGPVGVGLIALYNQVMELISSTAQLNLRSSAVRDVAAADESTLPRTVQTIKVITMRLGLAGTLLACVLSPLLSWLTFGTTDRWWAFCLLSCIVVFNVVAGGRQAILQGTGLLRPLALTSLWGAIGGTVFSIIMYWAFGLSGIIPSLIAFYLSILAASLWLSRDLLRSLSKVVMTWRVAFREGSTMLRFGIYMTISAVMTLLMNYVFLLWLTHTHGVSVVGCYQAGYMLINSYVGVVFSALAYEYYPRLVTLMRSPRAVSVAASHEMTVVLWVFMIVVSAFIALDNWIVNILFSSEFDVTVPYVSLAITGMIFRGISYCMVYVILARGDGRTYVVAETISVVMGLILNILGYTYWGYAGLGAAYAVWYAVYTLIVGIVYFGRYHLTIHRKALWLALVAICVAATALLLKLFVAWWLPLILAIILIYPAYCHILRK